MNRGIRPESTWVILVILAASLVVGPAAGETVEVRPVPLSEVPYILDIAVDRSDSAHVLLATSSGVYRATTDGTAVRVSISRNPFWNLVPHPLLGSVLYATGLPANGQNRGIIKSTDSGRTWRHTIGKDETVLRFHKIDISKVDPEIIYGLRDYVWVSRDGGTTWLRTGLPPGQPYDIAASSVDAAKVYVATADGLFVSTDAGRSWMNALPELCGQRVTMVETSADGVVYAFALCGSMARGDERTGEWVVVNDEFDGCIIQHIAIDPSNGGTLYAVERCNNVMTSTDGGRTWRVLGANAVGLPRCPTNPYGPSVPEDERAQWLKSDANQPVN